ncbi:Ubiquitin-conjugating enzyme E2 6 [Entomophthora muscae]|uniref:Ubiquitin-conjugating enzyme E2 6 n=1 Tax=Entomophthora muscae TaxID=34485 RepID=A0ACC2U6N9_9FUNG|nr:Ubiquitin-conjugating enzyme E2 6 [Entomophthora muscae]
MSTTKPSIKRLTKEYKAIKANPPPFIVAKPLETDLLEWHYVLTGPPDTPYAGGQYHGRLIFPEDYPFKPPSIRMTTPSGRFKPDTRLCLSISDFHPDTWNPAWSVSTILNGLLSFMATDDHTSGSMVSTEEDRKAFAIKSFGFNYKNKKFREVFPELVLEYQEKLAAEALETQSRGDVTAKTESAELFQAEMFSLWPKLVLGLVIIGLVMAIIQVPMQATYNKKA